MGVFGQVLHFLWIKRDLEKIFSHRKRIIDNIFVKNCPDEDEAHERNN
jgi:hypothetical protein